MHVKVSTVWVISNWLHYVCSAQVDQNKIIRYYQVQIKLHLLSVQNTKAIMQCTSVMCFKISFLSFYAYHYQYSRQYRNRCQNSTLPDDQMVQNNSVSNKINWIFKLHMIKKKIEKICRTWTFVSAVDQVEPIRVGLIRRSVDWAISPCVKNSLGLAPCPNVPRL